MSAVTTTPERETVREDAKTLKVGQCPACSGYIWADVVVQSVAREPRWNSDNRPIPSVSAFVVAATVEHSCDAREDES